MTDAPTQREYRDLGPLGELLLKACPPDKNNIQSIPILATAIKVSSQAIYKWIRKVKVPADRATVIVAKSGGRVTLEDFHPYVFV